MANVFYSFVFALVVSLGRSVEWASLDAGVCPLAGCNTEVTPASALMQQVQQPQRERISKTVAKESAAVALPAEQATATKTGGRTMAAMAKRRAARRVHGSKIKPSPVDVKRQKRKPPVAASSGTSSKGAPASSEESAFPLSMMQLSSKHVGMARLASNSAPRNQHLRGWTAPLDEPGYQAIGGLKSDDDMEMFIRRVIDAYDCKITNQGGFMGIVPWFSGTTAIGTFVKLQETLLYAVLNPTRSPWLSYKNSDGTTGKTAELSFMGYVEVAATRKEEEMVAFARRVCDKIGVKVVNEDGFRGMVRWYSGADNFQDYGRLEQEVRSAANSPKTWAAWTDSAAGSKAAEGSKAAVPF